MATSNDVTRYKFFSSCGTQADISNDGTTAQRRKPQTEFNDAVLIGSEPLVDGVLFQVRIDKKVTSWTGSIMIGVTTTAPERFKFPTTVSALAEGCWILSGSSVLKDCKQSIIEYTQQNTETLDEGDTVGVMRRGGALHFYVNGQDLGVAEKRLPGKVYPIIDLYGRCAKVSIPQPSQATAARSTTSSSPEQLCFHSRAGRNVEVKDNGMRAQRKAASGEFNNAIVMSNRPLKDSELFEVQVKGLVERWAGSIEIGLTTHSPTTLTFPSSLTNLASGTWLVSGSSVVHNRDVVLENIGRSLEQLQVGDYVGIMRNPNSTMTLYVNGREVGVACSDIPPGVFGIVDLYGRCVEVAMANRSQNNRNEETTGMCGIVGGVSRTGNQQASSNNNRTSREQNETGSVPGRSGNQEGRNASAGQLTESTRSEAVRSGNHAAAEGVGPVVDDTRPTLEPSLKFHSHCGVNVELSVDKTRARRKQPDQLLAGAAVFTHRPLLQGVWFEVVVSLRADGWNGSLRMGVCGTSPDTVTFLPTTDAIHINQSWVLCGHTLYHCGKPLVHKYPLDLDDICEGSTVGVMVTSEGELHYSLNGQDMGCAVRGITAGAYGMVDICGQCAQVVVAQKRIVGCHVTTPGDHMTVASIGPGVVADVTVAPTTQMAPNISIIKGPLHPKCGSNVELAEGWSVASRVRSYKDGVVFSAHPLTVGEMFKIEVTKLADNWKGFLRVGLTSCVPDNFPVVPSLSSLLPKHSWIVNGSTVTENGATLTETYGAALCRVQVGDIVGVQLESDFTMHVFLNGEDLGIAATITTISQRLYAVVDLYGPIAAVKVIGEQKNVITHQAPPESFEVDQPAMVVKHEGEVTFAPTHSENIRLENGGRCACRFKSYSKGLVVTSVPLPSGQLFQVEVMEMNPSWSGTLSIGVTVLPPAQVISAIKAQQLPGQSFVIAANGEKSTALYIGGQEMDHLPADIHLLALKVGDTVGLLRQGSGALHFFLNGVHMVKLPCTVPEGVYGLVDLYGQCVKVALRPLTTWCDEVISSGMRSSSQPSPFTAQATPFIPQATPFTAQATPITPQATLFTAQATPITPQATPFTTQATPTSLSAPADKRPSLPGPTVLPKSLGVPWVLPSWICSYQNTCNTLVCESLLLPEAFFAMKGERSRCLCKDCCARGSIVSPVKSAGSPNMKYTLPFGWVEYKLELPPRAKSLRAEELWNVAYHGTAVGNVRSILDCGGLLLPGDRRLGGDEVKRPDGHYTEDYKPSNFDVNRIFMTPSAKYCGLGEVYTKPCRHTISGKEYSAKVMFQVLIEPGTFDVSAQTVDPANGKIDDHFSNSELEWSTKSHVSIILRHMYVKLERRTQ